MQNRGKNSFPLPIGSVFAAIVDLRDGESFGNVETFELNPGKAIFVPRGCGNSFQTLEDHTVYTYLVNEHWSPEATYTLVNMADPSLGITWPIPLDEAEISDKDLHHPALSEINRTWRLKHE
jgi:dTDP-4-dehydrorhamnose 3,5-epimerase-like enzyme